MIHWPSDKTTIGHLRLRSSGLDPLTAQLRVARALNTLSPHPTGLNPAAILCIRSLRDPKPGALRLQRGDARPSPEWECALAAAIDQLARRAARPIQDAVPANAEAVLFADHSELLACLACDWLSGDLSRWWWRSLFRTADVARAVFAAWLDKVEYAPLALHHLAMRQQATAFVRMLSEETARQMRHALVQAFGLYALHSTLDKAQDHMLTAASDARASTQTMEAELRAPSGPPWLHWISAAGAAELNVEQHCLLGIGLMLHHAPTIVRTAAFARAVDEWRQALDIIPDLPFIKASVDRPALISTLRQTQPGQVDAQPTQVTLQPRTAVQPTVLAQQNVAADPMAYEDIQTDQAFKTDAIETYTPDHPIDLDATPRQRLALRFDRPHELAASAESTSVLSANALSPIAPEVDRQETTRLAPTSQIQASSEPGVMVLTDQVKSEFGGLWYLINLGLFLNLYGDFTTPLTPGLELPIWDFVALIGRELIGERLLADPIWALLARLAGRQEDDPPGFNFDAPGRWHIPPDWLSAFASRATCQWSFDGDRLRVQHPAGFCVMDMPIGETTHLDHEFVSGELEPYGDMLGELKESGITLPDSSSRTRLDRWLGWLMPYVRARLTRALGVSDDELPHRLCEQRARIAVAPTHLDVYFVLADLPIETRLAGLDRDPGWVPAAGRFIRYHYE